MLAGILAEKEAALTRILAIAESKSPADAEKQPLIERVLNADRVFEDVFGEISGEFRQRAPQFADNVRRLQDAIGRIIDLDARIRFGEDKRRQSPPRADHPLTSAPRASKTEVLREYARNSNPYRYKKP